MATPAYQTAALALSPYVYYAMQENGDNTSGGRPTPVDLGSYGHNGTVNVSAGTGWVFHDTGPAWAPYAYKTTGALPATHGTNQVYINEVRIFMLQSTWTCMGWIKTSDATNNQIVYSEEYISGSPYLRVEIRTGRIAAIFNDGSHQTYIDGNGGNVSGSAAACAIADGNWHHFAVKHDTATTSVYIDGVLVYAYSDTAGTTWPMSQDTYTYFFSNTGQNIGSLMALCHTGLWKVALTTNQIQTAYNTTLVPKNLLGSGGQASYDEEMDG